MRLCAFYDGDFQLQSHFFTRLLANGTKDLSYGENGVVYLSESTMVAAYTVTPNQDIWWYGSRRRELNGSPILTSFRYYLLAHLLKEGTPDMSIGAKGEIELASGITENVKDSIFDAESRLLLLKEIQTGFRKTVTLSRLKTNGALDAAFGTQGTAVLSDEIPSGFMSGAIFQFPMHVYSDSGGSHYIFLRYFHSIKGSMGRIFHVSADGVVDAQFSSELFFLGDMFSVSAWMVGIY